IDVIQQHHGTSLVYYFYQRALQQQEDARAGGKIMNIRKEDIPEVQEESFRYSGPKPQTKESAIVSLADIVESASRSLEKPTPQKIEQLINELIEERIADGQLDECDLTLGAIRIIAERFRFTRMTQLHTRFAVFGGSGAGSGDEGAAFERRGLCESDIGHFAGKTFEWKILSQRKERITVPHKDAAQVGVAFELDSHHVVNLALVPIRGRPDIGNGIDRFVFRKF